MSTIPSEKPSDKSDPIRCITFTWDCGTGQATVQTEDGKTMSLGEYQATTKCFQMLTSDPLPNESVDSHNLEADTPIIMDRDDNADQ